MTGDTPLANLQRTRGVFKREEERIERERAKREELQMIKGEIID